MRCLVVVVVVVVAAALFSGGATAEENPKVEQALERLDSAIASEARRLGNANKVDETERILAIQKAVNEITPLNDPGKCANLRKVMFAKKLIGEWDRPTFPRTYAIKPQGDVLFMTELDPNKVVTNKGVVIVQNEDTAKVKLDSGHEWTIFDVSNDRLAIEEKLGTSMVNDGIVFRRIRK
jgi:hypothetical protein